MSVCVYVHVFVCINTHAPRHSQKRLKPIHMHTHNETHEYIYIDTLKYQQIQKHIGTFKGMHMNKNNYPPMQPIKDKKLLILSHKHIHKYTYICT